MQAAVEGYLLLASKLLGACGVNAALRGSMAACEADLMTMIMVGGWQI